VLGQRSARDRIAADADLSSSLRWIRCSTGDPLNTCSILNCVDTAASKRGDVILTESAEHQSAATGLELSGQPLKASEGFLQNLWQKGEGEACGLTLDEFRDVLATLGKKHNYGLAPGVEANAKDVEGFFASLHAAEVVLAHACARGREAAWERFLREYRTFLTQTAIAITGSSSLGQELADSLYAELYGLRELDGERRSPFASYSGRGSLRGWLRTTLVQRWRDHHRRTHREAPLDEVDCPESESPLPDPVAPSLVARALEKTLGELSAENRFLLSAYFLDRQALLQVARTLNVHEATASRRLSRLLNEIRKQLVATLQHNGLSRRAAEEALGTDPRDLEINLRGLLQSSQLAPFSEKGEKTAPADAP
jgi:RNA polymerase sigma-70 factor, ECF subfamily